MTSNSSFSETNLDELENSSTDQLGNTTSEGSERLRYTSTDSFDGFANTPHQTRGEQPALRSHALRPPRTTSDDEQQRLAEEAEDQRLTKLRAEQPSPDVETPVIDAALNAEPQPQGELPELLMSSDAEILGSNTTSEVPGFISATAETETDISVADNLATTVSESREYSHDSEPTSIDGSVPATEGAEPSPLNTEASSILAKAPSEASRFELARAESSAQGSEAEAPFPQFQAPATPGGPDSLYPSRFETGTTSMLSAEEPPLPAIPAATHEDIETEFAALNLESTAKTSTVKEQAQAYFENTRPSQEFGFGHPQRPRNFGAQPTHVPSGQPSDQPASELSLESSADDSGISGGDDAVSSMISSPWQARISPAGELYVSGELEHVSNDLDLSEGFDKHTDPAILESQNAALVALEVLREFWSTFWDALLDFGESFGGF